MSLHERVREKLAVAQVHLSEAAHLMRNDRRHDYIDTALMLTRGAMQVAASVETDITPDPSTQRRAV